MKCRSKHFIEKRLQTVSFATCQTMTSDECSEQNSVDPMVWPPPKPAQPPGGAPGLHLSANATSLASLRRIALLLFPSRGMDGVAPTESSRSKGPSSMQVFSITPDNR